MHYLRVLDVSRVNDQPEKVCYSLEKCTLSCVQYPSLAKILGWEHTVFVVLDRSGYVALAGVVLRM